MWPDIIFRSTDQFFQEPGADDPEYWQNFTNMIAEGLYTNIRYLSKITDFSDGWSEDFKNLDKAEKSFWYDYASGIPEKFKKLNLFIR